MLLRQYFTAFKQLLQLHTLLAGKVDDVVRLAENGSTVRENYVVAFPPPITRLNDDRYTAPQAPSSKADIDQDARIVAVDADGLLLLTDAVLTVIGKQLIVPGRTATPLTLDEAETETKHDPVSRLHFTNLTFHFQSSRST